MKRFISIFSTLCILLSCIAICVSAEEPTLTASSVTKVLAGEDFTVTLAIKNNPGVNIIKAMITAPDKLTIKNIEALGGFTAQSAKEGLIFLTNASDITNDIDIAEITFSVPSDMPGGDYGIDFTVTDCTSTTSMITVGGCGISVQIVEDYTDLPTTNVTAETTTRMSIEPQLIASGEYCVSKGEDFTITLGLKYSSGINIIKANIITPDGITIKNMEAIDGNFDLQQSAAGTIFLTSATDKYGDISIANITFSSSSDIKSGVYEIQFQVTDCTSTTSMEILNGCTATIEVIDDATSMEFTTATAPTYSLGDVNGDGRIRANDARLCLRIAADIDIVSDEVFNVADINSDGMVRANDARIILRISAELDSIDNYTGIQPAETTTVQSTKAQTTTGEEYRLVRIERHFDITFYSDVMLNPSVQPTLVDVLRNIYLFDSQGRLSIKIEEATGGVTMSKYTYDDEGNVYVASSDLYSDKEAEPTLTDGVPTYDMFMNDLFGGIEGDDIQYDSENRPTYACSYDEDSGYKNYEYFLKYIVYSLEPSFDEIKVLLN